MHQDKSGKARDVACPMPAANGGGKGGIIETNFKEETETTCSANRPCCAAAPLSW